MVDSSLACNLSLEILIHGGANVGRSASMWRLCGAAANLGSPGCRSHLDTAPNRFLPVIFALLATVLAATNSNAQSCPPHSRPYKTDPDGTIHCECDKAAGWGLSGGTCVRIACIGDAGRATRAEITGTCGGAFQRCFSNNSLVISIGTAGCLAGALFGCSAGMAGCAAVCNVSFTALEWTYAKICSSEIEPCYNDALKHDAERKALCAN
jgi:hypothetical protein